MVVDTTDVCLTESMLEDADIFSGQATVSTSINEGRNSFAVVNTGCFAELVLNTVGISFNVAFTVNDNGAVVRRGWCNGWSSPVRIGQKLTEGRRFLYGSQREFSLGIVADAGASGFVLTASKSSSRSPS
jgi:hypothetical protein